MNILFCILRIWDTNLWNVKKKIPVVTKFYLGLHLQSVVLYNFLLNVRKFPLGECGFIRSFPLSIIFNIKNLWIVFNSRVHSHTVCRPVKQVKFKVIVSVYLCLAIQTSKGYTYPFNYIVKLCKSKLVIFLKLK